MMPEKKTFLKTLWEKEKMLVTSIFSFFFIMFLLKEGQLCIWTRFNSLPNNIVLAWSKLKAFADNKLNVVKIMISLCDSSENTVGKGENASFLLFLHCFPKPFSLGSFKVRIVW